MADHDYRGDAAKPPKPSELSDLGAADDANVRGGGSIDPCWRDPKIPCIRPPVTIVPCVRQRGT